MLVGKARGGSPSVRVHIRSVVLAMCYCSLHCSANKELTLINIYSNRRFPLS